MGPAELIGLVRDSLARWGGFEGANEGAAGEVARLRSENQTLKDEIARLKHLPPRPPVKPSGMEKATERSEPEADKPARRRRGPGVSKLSIDRTVELTVDAPAGSRRKGYEDVVVQDLMLRTETTLYRRERWETPDGRQIVAPLSPGIVGGYGPQLRRLILMLHVQGQMTCERIVTLLTGLGLAISKRQLVRLDDGRSGHVQRRGRARVARGPGERALRHGRRHRRAPRRQGLLHHADRLRPLCRVPHRPEQIASFVPAPSDGRRPSYVINAAALAYMRAANLPQGVIDALAGEDVLAFACHDEWIGHLRALGLTELRVAPDPVRLASEAAMWGAIEEQGLHRPGRHRLRRRRTVPRRRACALLGSRRAPHPQARPRQRQTTQRHRGRAANDLVVLSPA